MAKADTKVKIDAKDIMFLRNKTSAGIGLCREALEVTGGDIEKAIAYINEKSDAVSRLHNMTGAKIGLCKIALQDAEQDFEKALQIIKERGWESDPVDDSNEKVGEGAIGVYHHGTDRKTVALVEVQCITDFVARNEKFIELTNELAKQVAAMKPKFVSKESIPEDKVAELRELFTREAKEEGKPENILEKIIEGKMAKYFEENCLMQQKWFKDDSKTMQNLFDEAISQMGEALVIKRILLWEFGK
ncbi:MAG: elongation factor Ts [Candidatus Dojkabacteria bacterium]|nr:MAG: elongation factor Ts [Candidatus Dojkabacteria bacterium]